METAVPEVVIYTDGACRGNPGPGGWGAIIVYGQNEMILAGGEEATTNNRMELTAVISALSALNVRSRVRVVSDSRYTVDSINLGRVEKWRKNGWKKADRSPALNCDLWERLTDLCEKHEVVFEWVEGHSGHPYNERCDRLATAYADGFPTPRE